MLAAVKQDGLVLQYADKKLQADKEVVLAAVKKDSTAMQYADEITKEFSHQTEVLPEIVFSCQSCLIMI